MKIHSLFALILAALALLSACSGGIAEATETTGIPESAETKALPAATEKETPAAKVTDPLTWADIEALPLASEGMTEEEMRKLCVDFYVLQGSFRWTPSETFMCIYSDGDQEYRKGVLYGGLPYTHASSSLYAIMDIYDETTGVMDVSKCKAMFGSIYGNDCADSIKWAWSRVCNTITFSGSGSMVPANGCLQVGEYKIPEGITHLRQAAASGEDGGKNICKENGEAVMFAAYALLKPADAMTNQPHARMVMENHPSYKADGSISGTDSYILFCEQVSTNVRSDKVSEGRVRNVAGIKVKYSYQNLFNTGYIPVTIAEFSGADPIEKAEAWLEIPEGGDWNDGVCTSNYRVARVFVSVTDAEGNEAYSFTLYGSDKEQYGIALSRIVKKSTLRRNLEAGREYAVTVSATVGTGETLTAYAGAFTV